MLNTTETFATEHPDIVKRVLGVYEQARKRVLADPAALKTALIEAAKLPDAVIAKQLERTDLQYSRIGSEQRETILKAGLALQQAGVLPTASSSASPGCAMSLRMAVMAGRNYGALCKRSASSHAAGAGA